MSSSWWGGACVAATLALFTTGFPELAERERITSSPKPGAFSTVDHWLGHTALPDPAVTIRGVLAEVPAEQGILVIGPADHPSLVLFFYVVSTLTFPNKVGLVMCDPSGQAPNVIYSPPTTTIGAALVWTPATANAPGPGRPVGPYLHFVTGTGTTEWPSYCS